MGPSQCHVSILRLQGEEHPNSIGILQFATLADISVLEDVPGYETYTSLEWKTDTSPSALSDHRQIGLKQVMQTLKVTAQRRVKSTL